MITSYGDKLSHTTNSFHVSHQHFTVLSMQRAYVTASRLQYLMICLDHTESKTHNTGTQYLEWKVYSEYGKIFTIQ